MDVDVAMVGEEEVSLLLEEVVEVVEKLTMAAAEELTMAAEEALPEEEVTLGIIWLRCKDATTSIVIVLTKFSGFSQDSPCCVGK